MENYRKDSSKMSLPKLRQIKMILLSSIGIFILRYLLLITSIIWVDIFIVKDIPVLFISQVILEIIAFAMFCYGLMGIKEYFTKTSLKRNMRRIVIILLSMIVLLIAILFVWGIASFIPISESFPYELWVELIIIAMPFAELIPFTLAMVLLSINFWSLRKTEGWMTRFLISPFFLLPLTVVRILAAVLKVINILEPTKYLYAWKMADFSRIISAILGIILFVEILINIWRIKPKIIIQQSKNTL
ncbi:MAG: hypothetical protein KGD59_09285 [Candidatus Heimdallarchaeota archaeon]|nr:hypothetical protein [Candidatus Heimdallarchaeota archaeon]MBY8994727.1 hypothetical protein [Candidatus Heimdallarchaeota archaeon]